MKAFKTIFKILAAIVAVAAVAGGIYLVITRLVGDKKAATYYDDEDFFECDCDQCDVIDCDGETAKEVAADLEAEAETLKTAAKVVSKKAKK